MSIFEYIPHKNTAINRYILVLTTLTFMLPSFLMVNEAEAQDCESFVNQFRQAMASNGADELRGLVPQINIQCPAVITIAAKGNLGMLVARISGMQLDSGVDSSVVYSDFQSYIDVADHWEYWRALGDLAASERDYSKASEYYFLSLETILNERKTPEPPPDEIVIALHDVASETLTLASRPPNVVTRSGTTQAYYRSGVRGIAMPPPRPPITFVFGEANLDERGRQTVSQIVGVVEQQAPQSLILVGHTDPVGSDEANLKLSRDRVAAFAGVLSEQGYTGAIQAWWCGERVPPTLNNPDRYSEEETHQLSRRVEVYYSSATFDAAAHANCFQ